MSNINENLIFDIGMHNGRDSEFYLLKGFKVVSVDASPKCINDAKKMFANEIESGKLKLYNNAISDKTGSIKFKIYKNHDDWSSAVGDWNMSIYKDDEVNIIDVETIGIDQIIKNEGTPYYLKIDIEGSDIHCLTGLKKVEILPKFLSVELVTINNFKENSNVDYLELLCTLRSLGYTKFQLIDQSKHNEIEIPKPAKEGCYVNYNFDGYSSGLFGKELPDNWQTIDKITFDYLTYIGYKQDFEIKNEVVDWRQKLAKYFYKPTVKVKSHLNRNGWFDVHATY